MENVDRTRSDFELWCEDGALFLAQAKAKDGVEKTLARDFNFDDIGMAIPDDAKAMIIASAVKIVATTTSRDILNIVVNNLELIYAIAPEKDPKTAITIAFTTGFLTRYFDEVDLKLAVFKSLNMRHKSEQ